MNKYKCKDCDFCSDDSKEASTHYASENHTGDLPAGHVGNPGIVKLNKSKQYAFFGLPEYDVTKKSEEE